MIVSTLVAASLMAPAKPVICIDPGHPSENGVGTQGKEVTEVQLVWDLGVEAGKRLRGLGYSVVFTKSKVGEKVTNARRAEIANEAKANLLLRLHADAGNHSGWATFYPDRKGTVGKSTGPSDAVIKSSTAAAKAFHPAAIKALGGVLKDAGLKTDRATNIGGKQGALTGSILSKVPVLLVEVCVLTNPSDEKVAKSKEGREAMVNALVAGTQAAVPIPKK
jgi:N-acetylmuramoyl-L-alanine amidase